MPFGLGSALKNAANLSGNAFGTISEGLGVAQKLGSALSNLSNPGNLMSALRSMNLPAGGNTGARTGPAEAKFQDGSNPADWRVRLSIPPGPIWKSDLFRPLRDAGGLVFPYTPTISINHNATYTDQTLTHQNYQFVAYQYSKVSDIQIVGDFAVEDAVQAQYWLSAVHFLRSVTKMYTGDDEVTAGNPPPLLMFNAYGDYVFRNIPVVVKGFSVTLPKDVDYITTNITKLPDPRTGSSSPGGNALDKISETANALAGLTKASGITKAANAFRTAGSLAQGLSQAKGLGGQVKSGGKSAVNDSHVPTQSSFTVTIMPVYSRTKVREFSLSRFVQGEYVSKGYL